MSSEQRSGPAAMEGSGFYNRNSAMQAAGIAQLLPLWEMACRNVEVGLETPLIVDYGSSQGRNSMAPVRIAIEELRRRTGTNSPIEVIHTDLPTNDFSSLFKALQEEPDSYMAGLSDIFPAAIGRSYFDPLLPPGRVHLGWNTFTLQWMSTRPADAPDGIVAGESQSAEVSTAVRTQLDIDWRRFLEMRSLEMRAGAKILSAFTCRTSEGTGWEWLYGELWSAVLDLERASLLKEEERCHIAIPIGYRTLEDINAPFSTSGRFAGLEIERIEFFRIPDPFWDDFQRTGDAAELGRRQADSTRAWAGPSITGRIGPNRDRAGLVDDLFARFAARVSAAPRKHEPHLAAVLLTKRR